MISDKKYTLPPKPRRALHMGVTGHRPEGLSATDSSKLQTCITETLRTIEQIYRQIAQSPEIIPFFADDEALPPRLLSPLAEGADRLAAEAALTQGFVLHCPLPFPRRIYAEDFQHDASSLKAFEDLLQKAERVLELDGTRAQPERAYRNIGHFVLNHADLLLAIWNGQDNDATPGTAGVVAAALRRELPIVWINVVGTEPSLHLHLPGRGQTLWQDWDVDALETALRKRLLPAAAPHAAKKSNDSCRAYFTHGEPCRTLLGSVYRAFFNLLGRRRLAGIFGARYRDSSEAQWQQQAALLPGGYADASIAEHFIRADSLATYYADQYRGTFILLFLLGGFAVLFALLGALFADDAKIAVLAELSTLILIAALFAQGQRRALHQRWLDYRLLAERLRHHAYLAPIGGIARWRLPAFHHHHDSSHAWIGWLVDALGRAEGIPRQTFDSDYCNTYRAYLLAAVEDQAEYHKNNAERNERIAALLQAGIRVLFAVVFVSCVLHLFVHAEPWSDVLTLAAATLPAFGAAFAGIAGLGEFERIAERSEGMAKLLAALAEELRQGPMPSAGRLAEQALEVIDVMSQELSDWRVIFRAKPLEMHA